MRCHREDYLPFWQEEEGADGDGDVGARYEEYCDSIRDTAVWGG